MHENRSRNPIKSVLVMHEDASELRSLFDQHLSQIDVYYVDKPGKVKAALEGVNPDAVFAIHQPSLSGSIHREAALYPSVKWFHVGGSGVDQLLPWPGGDTVITNCAGVLAKYLAETVAGGMLALNNFLPDYFQQQQDKLWRAKSFRPLCEQTLLIVGLGAIGGYVADLAKALGMRVMATRRSNTPHPSVDQLFKAEQLSDIIGNADYVSLHLRLDDETHHLFDQTMLGRMKPGARIINTARGGIVDQQALIHSLKTNHIAAAFLDVFEQEPLAVNSPLWAMSNVIITPHCADNTIGYATKFADHFCDNLARWNSGASLHNQLSLD
jgi:phosphoglycerate dehydrogenase-like enzyme